MLFTVILDFPIEDKSELNFTSVTPRGASVILGTILES